MQMTRRTLAALVTILGAMLYGGPSSAEGLKKPIESPILVVAGKITATNKGERAVFDRPMLEEIGGAKIHTATPWYTGKMQFEGVLFANLIKAVGATGDRVVITALDDYTREIPIEELVKHNVILAMKRNGEYLPISDKGPLFVVYPYDENPALANEKYYSKSIWQVRRIEVR